MGLFDGLVATVEGAVGSVEAKAANLAASARAELGYAPAPAPDYSADISAMGHDLKKWDLVLSSLDKSMNAKDGADDLSAQVRAWFNSDFHDAVAALVSLKNGTGSPDAARSAHDSAVSNAQNLQAAIQARWSQFASQGVPTVSDYVRAPVTALTETGTRAYASASRAASQAEAAVEKVAGSSARGLSSFMTYAPWALGGVAVLYVLSILPRGRGAN